MKGKLKLAIASLGLVAFASSGIGVGGLLESHLFEQPSVVQVEATSDPWADLDFYSYGAEFRDQLARLIEDTGDRTVSYSGSTDILRESDESPDHPGCITPFYHPDTDYLTDNYPNNWNKEHVWPNSRGAGKSGPGSDPHMLRPTVKEENTDRGNNFYGIGSKQFDPASVVGYEPSRGEAARIIFYVATRYHNKLSLSNNPNDSTSENTMGTLRYLVQWNNRYPVTDAEIRRNEYLDSAGFGRNPFIDNPDFANYIYTEEGLRTSVYEGGDFDPDAVHISLSPSSLRVAINSSENISASAYGTSEDTLVWYSSDESIATVSGNGGSALVKGIAQGTAKIYCYSTVDPSVIASCSVTVFDPSSSVGGDEEIKLTASSMDLGNYVTSDTYVEVGGVEFGINTVGSFDNQKTIQLKRSEGKIWNRVSNGLIVKLEASYAKGEGNLDCYFGTEPKADDSKAIESSSGSVYTYTPDGDYNYFYLENNGGGVANLEYLTVYFASPNPPEEVEVSSISVSPSSLDLAVGDVAELTVSVSPSDATDKTLAFESSDEAVATVEGGNVMAIAPGQATITVSASNGVKAEVAVNVISLPDEPDEPSTSEESSSSDVPANSSSPNDPSSPSSSGCFGSIGGTIAGVAVVLGGLVIVLFIRGKRHG